MHLDRPWEAVKQISFPVKLHRQQSNILDDLFELPPNSALSIARVDAATGQIQIMDWRQTGELGFYPASSIKFITAAMTLRFLDEYSLPIDAVVKLGDDPPISFRELLGETIVLSGNETFNTLQECVGFAPTYQEMMRWGLVKTLIRRHFKNPRYNHSRPVTIYSATGAILHQIPSRPAVDIPLHDGNGLTIHNLESNWACTDDLIKTLAAVLFGPTRHNRYFSDLTHWCSMTNYCDTRAGLRSITAQEPNHPPFVLLNKAGWYPEDSANIDMGYVYDVSKAEHYLYAIYYHGTEEAASIAIADVAHRAFVKMRSESRRFWGI